MIAWGVPRGAKIVCLDNKMAPMLRVGQAYTVRRVEADRHISLMEFPPGFVFSRMRFRHFDLPIELTSILAQVRP